MDRLDIRPVAEADVPMLWHFLAIAAYEPDARAAGEQPVVAAHLANWPGNEDFGFVAWMDGRLVGAAWVRQFSRDESPSVYLGDRTPELSIGVEEDVRGKGVGTQLLDALLHEAGRREIDVCLTVRHTNPAMRLYQGRGFERLPHLDVPNRVGGISHVMLWRRDGNDAMPARSTLTH